MTSDNHIDVLSPHRNTCIIIFSGIIPSKTQMRDGNDHVCSLIPQFLGISVCHIDGILPDDSLTSCGKHKVQKADIQSDESDFYVTGIEDFRRHDIAG